MDADVVIAGAGPTGLMLACELHLAGVRPIVLERLAEPTGLSKALALVGRSVDILDYRGLLGRFHDLAAVAIPNAAHFALIPLDLGKAGNSACAACSSSRRPPSRSSTIMRVTSAWRSGAVTSSPRCTRTPMA